MRMAIDAMEVARLFREGRRESVPAYRRLKDVITEQIGTGRWPEGDLLPPENQLVRSLGLSRMTINRALRELSTEGLLVRVAGVGTFVAERKSSSALYEVHNIADEVTRRGHRHRTEVILLREEPADPRLHRLFGIQEGYPVFHSRIVHFENDVAIQLEDRHVNPELARDYLEQDFTAYTPNNYLSQIAPLGKGEHVVEAVRATAADCAQLGIEETEPCLLIHRRTWSADRLVSAARLLHPGSRYRLEGTFDCT
ncbi:GntR family transcriptional regulator [Tamaricihabitans halophyticus]|uniref:Histidine utilization repressor n=1 Tax=Tamaricihabitans halophyticus TaxID=1262583 RepID=A0A4R2Q5S8_9PSEU|nr:histidine utilization repressor [Tamaricihabitans halophyticus]TCP42071.1 GntR family transcriptional regulator [Tamaricihabitans halophyticus]